MPNETLSEAVAFLGRLHVVVLHLPIGMLVALGLLEVRAWWRNSSSPTAAWSLALFSSASAALTALFGWFLSWSGSYEPTLLFRHRWLGVAVAAGAAITFGLRSRADRQATYRLMLTVTLVLLLLGGHQGGALTHGTRFLFPSGGSAAERVDQEIESRAALRVLETHCHECHGSSQQENGLRLDDRSSVLAGGESGRPAVVPGRATESELVRRATLPTSDDDSMPPDGRARLSAEEMLVLIDWINAGASFERVVSVDAPAPAVLEDLVARGLAIEPLSEGDARLSVSLRSAPAEQGSEPLLLILPLASQVAWLDLKGRRLSEAEWSALGRFENLTRLHLEQTNAEDRHLEPLAAMSGLELVNLYDTEVGDRGIGHLVGLTALRDVFVWRSRVTDTGVRDFLERNPGVRFHRGAVP